MTVFAYRGLNSNGTHTVGTFTEPVGDWVRERFVARWVYATVTLADDPEGDPVGGIDYHPDNGQRMWWADRFAGRLTE